LEKTFPKGSGILRGCRFSAGNMGLEPRIPAARDDPGAIFSKALHAAPTPSNRHCLEHPLCATKAFLGRSGGVLATTCPPPHPQAPEVTRP
jgi:hypothetical protein